MYAFLTVLESVVNAVYWFRMYSPYLQRPNRLADVSSFLLYLQICSGLVDGGAPIQVPSHLVTCESLADNFEHSGAQIVFRTVVQPVFSRYFSQSGSTAADLRSKADQASKPHAM